jgi:predicted nucleotidyltransferase
MVKQSDYTKSEIQACFSVLLEIMTVLGEFRDNIVIVGGNVPSLLLPLAEEKHSGTLDIDLALDSNHISDDTYKTITKTLSARGYYQKKAEQLFIFHRDIADRYGRKITVEIDLLAPEYGGTGKSRRHQKVQDAMARKTRGCDLVFESAVRVNLAGTLPNGAKNEVTARVASIGPFLVMKGMALWERMKEKDAYDIYYCCRNYPGGLDALMRDIRPLISSELAKEGLEKIKTKFASVDGIGPTAVADFLEIIDQEEKDRVKREAFELVDALMNGLGIKPFLRND